MIICQCNVITDQDIREAVRGLLADDPWIYLTLGAVYRELGKRGKCFGCVPTVVDHVIEVVETERQAIQNAESKWVDPTLTNLRLLKDRRTSVQALKRRRGQQHERRSAGYREA